MNTSAGRTQSPATDQRVTFNVRLVARQDHDEELLQTFRSLLGPIRGTPGCVRCSLLEDVQDSDELELFVEWRSQDDFVDHVESALFRRLLVGLELAAEEPEIEIRTIAGLRGMDLLREILACDETSTDAREEGTDDDQE